jgi:hypothetical protein
VSLGATPLHFACAFSCTDAGSVCCCGHLQLSTPNILRFSGSASQVPGFCHVPRLLWVYAASTASDGQAPHRLPLNSMQLHGQSSGGIQSVLG